MILTRKFIFVELYKICTVLGITPFHGFEDDKLPTSKKLLNYAWIIFLLLLRIFTFVFKILPIPVKYKEETATTIILEVLSGFFYWLLPFGASIDLIFRRDVHWGYLIRQSEKLYENFPVKQTKKLYIVTMCVLYIAMNVIILICSGRDFYYLIHTPEKNIFEASITMLYYMDEFIWLYTFLLATSVGGCLQEHYENLRLRLKRAVNVCLENKFRSLENVELTVKEIRFLKGLYIELNSMSTTIINIYGWRILCFILFSVLDCLDILNGIIFNTKQDHMLEQIVEFAVLFIYQIFLVVTYESVTNEEKELIKYCYAMEERFPLKSEIRDELLELAKLTKFFAPNFSSFKLVGLNRKMLLSILSSCTMYLIAIVQLNSL